MSSSAPARELAGGKLLLDEPAAGVTRLTISNPAKRNALDHPILDAITATLGELTGARCVIVTGPRRFLDAIGAARTRELFLLGRYIDAEEALQWGLINRVASQGDLDAAALELARELAANAPLAQTGNKRVIGALLDARGQLEEQLERELIELRRASFASKDMREGMRAFAEKRPPRWSNE